jgi:hypothetical protein
MAMAGYELARYNLKCMDSQSVMQRAMKHWIIAASSGCSDAMHTLIKAFERCITSRESINSTLIAYNNSRAEMRSKARDAYIKYQLYWCKMKRKQ